MDAQWQKVFHARMRGFEAHRASRSEEFSVSIKIRVVSGCFHREHSPRAYRILDKHLNKSFHTPSELAFQEHESGPELLVWLALGTAGVTLAKSVLDLITVIIQARSEGIKKGDKPSEPLEVIIRRVHDGREFREELVLRVGYNDRIEAGSIEQRLKEAIGRLIRSEEKKDS